MSFSTLISTAALASRVDDLAHVIVDCRFKLDDTAWGAHEYEAGHIPGAVYAQLDRDLSGAKTGTNGRHPLPSPDVLASTLSRFGITSGVQVVAYDQDNGMYASRFWWMLRWMGHDAVAVLDGGFAKWLAEGRPTRGGVETRASRAFVANVRPDMILDAGAVATLAGSSRSVLLDARAPQRFRGEVEPLDKTPGHIPGARNYFFQGNIDEHGTFRTPEELRERLGAATGGVAATDLVCYCGSGVTACHNLLALEHAGLKGAKLYPGSWSEWCSDETRPVAKGDE
jgi:thiosulfate/3-mercaptopyruvate sulfurtransferase